MEERKQEEETQLRGEEATALYRTHLRSHRIHMGGTSRKANQTLWVLQNLPDVFQEKTSGSPELAASFS